MEASLRCLLRMEWVTVHLNGAEDKLWRAATPASRHQVSLPSPLHASRETCLLFEVKDFGDFWRLRGFSTSENVVPTTYSTCLETVSVSLLSTKDSEWKLNPWKEWTRGWGGKRSIKSQRDNGYQSKWTGMDCGFKKTEAFRESIPEYTLKVQTFEGDHVQK